MIVPTQSVGASVGQLSLIANTPLLVTLAATSAIRATTGGTVVGGTIAPGSGGLTGAELASTASQSKAAESE